MVRYGLRGETPSVLTSTCPKVLSLEPIFALVQLLPFLFFRTGRYRTRLTTPLGTCDQASVRQVWRRTVLQKLLLLYRVTLSRPQIVRQQTYHRDLWLQRHLPRLHQPLFSQTYMRAGGDYGVYPPLIYPVYVHSDP